METFFLICFIFGTIFTAASFLLGFASAGLGHIGGHEIGAHAGHGHAGHVGHHEIGHLGHHEVGHAGHLGHVGHHEIGHVGHHEMGHAAHGHAQGHQATTQHGDTGHNQSVGLPIFSLSSLLAFLTWFGAAGYLLLAFAGWNVILAALVAIVAGAAGAFIIAMVLGKIMAGERVMDPRDYELEGTIARVTVGISAGGVGEIVFSMAGARRSEAARGIDNQAIPRETEVVVVDYSKGVAAVETWDELVHGESQPDNPEVETIEHKEIRGGKE